jgi:hypothetical protein
MYKEMLGTRAGIAIIIRSYSFLSFQVFHSIHVLSAGFGSFGPEYGRMRGEWLVYSHV